MNRGANCDYSQSDILYYWNIGVQFESGVKHHKPTENCNKGDETGIFKNTHKFNVVDFYAFPTLLNPPSQSYEDY